MEIIYQFSFIVFAVLLGIVILIWLINYTKFKEEYKFYEPLSHVPPREAYRSKGTMGEFKCFSQLKTLNTHYQMLANIYLPTSNGETTEIDLLFKIFFPLNKLTTYIKKSFPLQMLQIY